jgi:hypothetical protein
LEKVLIWKQVCILFSSIFGINFLCGLDTEKLLLALAEADAILKKADTELSKVS